MTDLKPLPTHLVGGNFLLHETDPQNVFTPEDFTKEQRMMAQSAEKFMDKEVLPQMEALEHQEEGLAPKLARKAAELGFFGMEVDEAYGGLGLSKSVACQVEEQFGRLGGFGVTCGAHNGIGTQPIIYFGTEEQKKKYLPKLCSGEWLAAYALSEAGSGSDALGMRTKAVLSADKKNYVLNGTKMWISNSAWASLFVIFAKVDGEHVTAFLVERSFPGVSFGKEEHKLGIKSSSTRRVILEDVHVPVENVLGQVGKGAYIAFNILNLGRYKLGGGVLGGCKESLKNATRYSQERQQFGRPIASFGLIQHKLAEMATKIFVGESTIYRTGANIDAVIATGEKMEGGFLRGIDEHALECSICKVSLSEILGYVTDEALQVYGGYGYTEEFPAARGYRDARINRIFEGTNEINRLFIPSMLLRRAQRNRLPLIKAIEQVSKSLMEMAPMDSGAAGDEIQSALAAVASAKKLGLMAAGIAYQKFGDKMIDQQEVLAAISDIIIDVYLAESALLRVQKNIAKNHPAAGQMKDMALIFTNDAIGRMELNARNLLAAISEGDELRAQLGLIRRLLKWLPLNTTQLRRNVAKRLLEVGSYNALIGA